jgi:hypothetical protein
MSELKEALEQLDYWLYDNKPEIFDSLPSGLSSEEIDEQSYSLMFDLSTEIRELYQWRNGGGLLFYSIYGSEGLAYFPLNAAVRQTHDTGAHIDNFLEKKQIENAFFMFREFERWIHFVDCSQEGYSPIFCMTDDSYLRLAYTNITAMVLTSIECYEGGHVTFNRFGGLQLNDEKGYKNILLKNCVEQDSVYQHYSVDKPLQE